MKYSNIKLFSVVLYYLHLSFITVIPYFIKPQNSLGYKLWNCRVCKKISEIAHLIKRIPANSNQLLLVARITQATKRGLSLHLIHYINTSLHHNICSSRLPERYK